MRSCREPLSEVGIDAYACAACIIEQLQLWRASGAGGKRFVEWFAENHHGLFSSEITIEDGNVVEKICPVWFLADFHFSRLLGGVLEKVFTGMKIIGLVRGVLRAADGERVRWVKKEKVDARYGIGKLTVDIYRNLMLSPREENVMPCFRLGDRPCGEPHHLP